jgi:F-type H+-transporting ATPase subunit alpha
VGLGGHLMGQKVTDQVISLYAGANGYLDDIYLTDVARFEREMLAYVASQAGDLYGRIRDQQEITPSDRERLDVTLRVFKNLFAGMRKAAPAKEGTL